MTSLTPALFTATVATWAAFLPPVAALWARRTLRDAAGQIAACWFVMALVGSIGYVRFFVLKTQPQTSLNSFTAMLFPLLLIPPLLTWIGGPIKRWRWTMILVWSALWLVASVELVEQRAFKIAIDPLMSGFMVVISAWAMAVQVQRTSVSPSRTGWFWILLGHIVYFAMSILRLPLTEVLAFRDRDAAAYVTVVFMTLYSVVYALIARGMLIRDAVSTPVPAVRMPRVA